MRRIPTSRRHAGGFSLIEIAIVVVLIGGVMALVANSVMGSKDRANVRLADTQLMTLAGKIDQFRADTGKLPESLDQLSTSPGLAGALRQGRGAARSVGHADRVQAPRRQRSVRAGQPGRRHRRRRRKRRRGHPQALTPSTARR